MMTAVDQLENIETTDLKVKGKFARPLRVMFVITSMPVGGAETLLIHLIRTLDRDRFQPELCCLKELGPLGEELKGEIPTFSRQLNHKFDLRILPRLTRLFASREIDAVITVGAGDKMFWGRLAAYWAKVPVILSALHSTGWPDGVGRLNRMLTKITDGFIAVAKPHGQFMIEHERFPKQKVRVIPNGVDTEVFRDSGNRQQIHRQQIHCQQIRGRLGIDEIAPVATIVAALRVEKNHEQFLHAAKMVREKIISAQFLIVGDGPQRQMLENLSADLELEDAVHFLGSRNDIADILTVSDVFVLTSHNEANPVSILEAMSCGKPVVAPDVGSISETVLHEKTGFLTTLDSAEDTAKRVVTLFQDPKLATQFGEQARRQVIEHWSLEQMVRGYEKLISEIFLEKTGDIIETLGERVTSVT